jgi:hypothetical protein
MDLIMTKDEVLTLIHSRVKVIVDPVELLNWTWLRVIILQIPETDWARYVSVAEGILSQ